MKILSIEKIKEFFSNDTFVKHNGIEIESVDNESAVVKVILNKNHFNAGSVVQGGLIFTLGDFAFAVLSNVNGFLTVSQSASITYISAPKGTVLYAKAEKVSEKGKNSVVSVKIYDDFNTLSAYMTVNGFVKTEIPKLLYV